MLARVAETGFETFVRFNSNKKLLIDLAKKA